MNEHSHITNLTNFCHSVFSATEVALNEWKSEDNLPFPTLVGMVSVKMNIDPNNLTDIDPIVRQYVRKHPDWKVSRGAKGGIQRLSVYDKKQAEKAAVEAAKKQIAAQIDAKVAAQSSEKLVDSSEVENG